ncbi:hypothetical protein HU200_000215 [Digitaria exilis]|uniref:Uncharacterized protein n=1 Tax=Digitaria exilis TaxID=1010633 RepID=A0A835G0F4_9POAL|nr:hypothetical protein HU200_000215 [Digitaria exilis]
MLRIHLCRYSSRLQCVLAAGDGPPRRPNAAAAAASQISQGGSELPVDQGAGPRRRLPQSPRASRLRRGVHRLPLPRRLLRRVAQWPPRRLLLWELSGRAAKDLCRWTKKP